MELTHILLYIIGALLIMLATMDYTRRTGPLTDLLRRRGEDGGMLGMLVVAGFIIAAVLLLPRLELGVDKLLPAGTEKVGAGAGSQQVRNSKVKDKRDKTQTRDTTPDDLANFGYERSGNTEERKLLPEPEQRRPVPRPSPRSVPAGYPVAEAVKGHPTGPGIVYVIPTWAGGDPQKALRKLIGPANRHYVFAVNDDRGLVQVGYGPFATEAEGVAYRKRYGLKRAPRAFRIVRP